MGFFLLSSVVDACDAQQCGCESFFPLPLLLLLLLLLPVYAFFFSVYTPISVAYVIPACILLFVLVFVRVVVVCCSPLE